jgi:hypothetical protein
VARRILSGEHAVGRVIARPFTGPSGAYVRTDNTSSFAYPGTGHGTTPPEEFTAYLASNTSQRSPIEPGQATLIQSTQTGMWCRLAPLPSNASHEFAKLVRSIGLDHLNLHGLRHGTATYMIAAGFDAVTVASILGNTSQVLLDTYADALNPRRLQAAEALGRIWDEAR